jgi:cytochrome oxidase Cu insertion factor (SCO1/SenC/PrrC family)
MPSVRWLAGATLGLALCTGAVHARGTPRSARPDVDPGTALEAPAPGFELLDQNGRLRSLAQLRGKVVLLAFVDTRCTNVCPLTTQSMEEARRLLGPAALRVQLVGINANPLATSVADVEAYTRAHELQRGWWFLTAREPALARVWRSYGVRVASVHGDVFHQPVIFLIDPRGRERKIFFTQMSYGSLGQQAEALAAAMAHLLPGHPAIGHPAALKFGAPLGPDATARLTVFGAGNTPRAALVLAPAQPHLLLFFASWLDGARLPAKLTVLDRYAALARAHGWPLPVAIDEVPTEAPGAGWRRRMRRMAGSLRVPVAADSLGRLADGYAVRDLPWFALTKSGRVLWQHDGWLSSARLAAMVSTAMHRDTAVIR